MTYLIKTGRLSLSLVYKFSNVMEVLITHMGSFLSGLFPWERL